MRPLPLAAAMVAGCAALYGFAVRTAVGQRLEDSTLRGFLDQARLFPLYRDVGLPPLDVAAATVAAGVLAIVAVGAVRRRWAGAVAALVAVGVALLAAEGLGEVLARPPLDVSAFGATGNSFPSGHTAIPIALVLGLAGVVPPSARGWVVGVGGAWVAVVSAGIQSMYWHRPSDVLGAALLTCAAALVVGHLRPGEAGPPVAAVPVLGPAALLALAAGTRTDSWTIPLLFSLNAWLTVGLLWLTVRSLGGEAALRSAGGARPPG